MLATDQNLDSILLNIIPQIQVVQFVPREHEIYRQISVFIVVFDAAGDSSQSPG